MRLLDKFVMIIYSIVFLIISIILFVLPFDIRGELSIDNVINMIDSIRGNYLVSIFGAIFFIIILSIIFSIFRNTSRKKKGSFLVLNNEFGEVTIHDETIIGLVRSIANEFEGIDNILTKVKFKDGKINIDLKGEAEKEISIPQISQQLQERIKTHIEDVTGAEVNNVDVEIVKVVNR